MAETEEQCPHCGSDDYGLVNEVVGVWLCLTCGYDTENGTSGVCPGGPHPMDARGDLCCERCWKRIPDRMPDVDGTPRPWRRRRSSIKRRRWVGAVDDRWWEHNNRTVRSWLLEHPVV